MLNPIVQAACKQKAIENGLPPENLMAVAEVESAGVIFWTINGKNLPPARPEAHYFYRKLRGAERDKAVSLGLAHPKYNVIKVPYQREAVYARINQMIAINETAALESCSWGAFQVMGENWKELGYASVKELYDENQSGIDGQIECMLRFVRKNNLLIALKTGDFTTFAKRYNGPAYRDNAYDTKMAQAAAKYKKALSSTKAATEVANAEVQRIQKIFHDLGHYKGQINGYEDQRLRDAIAAFQAENGLVADGKYGKMTEAKVEEIHKQKELKNGKSLGAVGLTGTAATSIGQQGLSYIQMLPEHPAFKIAITILTCAFVGVMLYGLYLQFKTPEAANA
jgi:hypothetical protein